MQIDCVFIQLAKFLFSLLFSRDAVLFDVVCKMITVMFCFMLRQPYQVCSLLKPTTVLPCYFYSVIQPSSTTWPTESFAQPILQSHSTALLAHSFELEPALVWQSHVLVTLFSQFVFERLSDRPGWRLVSRTQHERHRRVLLLCPRSDICGWLRRWWRRRHSSWRSLLLLAEMISPSIRCRLVTAETVDAADVFESRADTLAIDLDR